jgi:hypothetical protein
MLLYKGWLETRFRLLFALCWAGFCLLPWVPDYNPNRATVLAAVLSILLAGAGIATQPSFRAPKGLHSSMYFTLSLPVSRFRLLAVRAGLGWLEMTAVIGAWYCGIWILYPAVSRTAAAMFEYAVTVVACASGLYFIAVLLGTFLDEQWRMQCSMVIFPALWWLSNHTPFPASANIFRAMGEGVPLLTHTMPWTAMAFSLELAAILFFAALKVVQMREY